VLEEPETIMRKFKRAVTDSDDPPRIVRAEDKPGVTNLIEILAALQRKSSEEIEAQFADARGYGDLKTAVGEAVVAELAPVRERYEAIRGDEAVIEQALADGAEKARALAAPTLSDVRDAMGVGPPR
jgi:tryptophanyl-tRNA synthetase